MQMKICFIENMYCTFDNLYNELMCERCTICQNYRNTIIYCSNYILQYIINTQNKSGNL